MWRATLWPGQYRGSGGFLSTLSVWRATDHYGWRWYNDFTISIHALRVESDSSEMPHFPDVPTISIHALRVESDPRRRSLASRLCQFLSTLSVWRATTYFSRPSLSSADFYPRSPCGERPTADLTLFTRSVFLSTLSVWRATPWIRGGNNLARQFLSTLSVWRATWIRGGNNLARQFLSTLSVWRATPGDNLLHHLHPNFYPRSPCGERQNWIPRRTIKLLISIHALRVESDGRW